MVNAIPACIHPALVGENVTLSGTLCPAGRVRGKASPDALNIVPVVFMADTVTLRLSAICENDNLTLTVSDDDAAKESEYVACMSIAELPPLRTT